MSKAAGHDDAIIMKPDIDLQRVSTFVVPETACKSMYVLNTVDYRVKELRAFIFLGK